MIPLTITVKTRGPTGRGMKREHNRASKQSWLESGVWFHRVYSDRRFSQSHARAAGYTPRKRTYEVRKLKRHGHTRPLEYSGLSRLRSRFIRVTSTSHQARVKYPKLRVFNLRHKNSQINMRQEFETLLSHEAQRVGEKYDSVYDREYNGNRDRSETKFS